MTGPRPPHRIVVFDDDPVIRDFLADALRALGHEARVFASGGEALAFLEADDGAAWPSLVMMDVTIPGEDAARTLAALRRLLPGAPVLLSTGRGREPEIEALGADAYLPKPYRLKALREALDGLRG